MLSNASKLLWSTWMFRQTYVILFTPLILLPLPICINTQEAKCAYILFIMAVFWITEAVPLYVTALIPIFGLPLAGIVSSRTVASYYITEASLVFTGGLIVALAIENSNFHRRLAMLIILKIGQSPKLIMAGLMFTTMVLSMWISNTGATAIMITVVEGILDVIDKDNEIPDAEKNCEMETEFVSNRIDENVFTIESERNGLSSNHINSNNIHTKTSEICSKVERTLKLKYAYYLSIAYAANIGGTGVITGTPPNLLLQGILSESFTEPTGVNFTSWMMLNTPGMIISTIFGWLWLQYKYIGFGKQSSELVSEESKKKIADFIRRNYQKLGPMTYHEKSVISLFMLLVPLWIFRDPGFLYGWGRLIEDAYGSSVKIGDSAPVTIIIFLFFVLPAKNPFKLYKKNGSYSFRKSEALLSWDQVQGKVAWGLIILVGGGIAIAKGSDASGLSSWMGQELTKLNGLWPPLFLLLITTVTAGVTEIISNTSTTSIVLPVLRELSLGLCINPLYFMMGATVSASFAFMLPVATPPNAIVYYAGRIPSKEMMKTGFFMNLICIVVVNIIVNTLGEVVFDVHNLPTWANSSTSGTFPNC